MDVLKFPFQNLLINTVLRSVVMFVVLIFAFGVSPYNSYWVAVVHDAISLTLIYGKA
jgi:hypothetical protein